MHGAGSLTGEMREAAALGVEVLREAAALGVEVLREAAAPGVEALTVTAATDVRHRSASRQGNMLVVRVFISGGCA
ncbi:MAG: hypothetical protein IIZ88_03620 [Prevotella sp.]|nr:hypothetical protein [Prevotella sp.]